MIFSSQYGGCTVDRVDQSLSTYARHNEEQHRNIAKQFVKESEIDRYVDQQVTKDINDANPKSYLKINTLYTSMGQTPL